MGVEEDDLLKTDGNMLYGLTKSYWNGSANVPSKLQAQKRLADGKLSEIAKLDLDLSNATGMYLARSAQRIALLGQQYGSAITPSLATTAIAPYPTTAEQIGLHIVSLAQTNTLSISKRIRIDGSLVGSRMIGNTLYVVSTWQPGFASYALSASASTSEQDAKLAALSNKDIVPNIQIDANAAEPLFSDTDCYLQTSNAAMRVQITAITAFDLSSASMQRSSRCFVGGSEGLYVSPSNVYLTSSRFYSFDTTADLSTRIYKSGTTTDIHKFSLQGQAINYKGSGTVPGHLGWNKDKLAYRMSEYQGDLRVLSFTGETGWGIVAPMPAAVTTANASASSSPSTASASTIATTTNTNTIVAPSPATLTILRETNSSLQTVGSLPNSQRSAALGKPGEQVYAVQFVGSRAYVVTFRQTDPLYVIDVSNPLDPKTSGELLMPGFSDYLYPMGDKLLFGAGKDASDTGFLGGVKVALMDVSNPANPRVISSSVIGKRGSSATLDSTSHGINIFQQGNVVRIAMPVRVHETAPSANVTPQTFYNASYQGLQRFEIDTSAKTLVSKPVIKSLDFSPTTNYSQIYGLNDVANDRSVQIDAQLYYFSAGRFTSANW
jgi:Beta propeller domain